MGLDRNHVPQGFFVFAVSVSITVARFPARFPRWIALHPMYPDMVSIELRISPLEGEDVMEDLKKMKDIFRRAAKQLRYRNL